MSVIVITVDCDEKYQSGLVWESRFFLEEKWPTDNPWDGAGHIGPLLKERGKGRTASCFTSAIQETRVTLRALIGPPAYRLRSANVIRSPKPKSIALPATHSAA